jgi:hypothetical protein
MAFLPRQRGLFVEVGSLIFIKKHPPVAVGCRELILRHAQDDGALIL